MNKLNMLIEESGEEAWLFADLFASLLMTIVLLVNAHSAVTLPKSTDDSGKEPPKTRLVYLIDAQTASLDNKSTQGMPIKALIATLKKDNAQAEIVGSAVNNGVELFELFQALEKQGLEYRYSIAP
jgi:biopolymer transport protein ExbD